MKGRGAARRPPRCKGPSLSERTRRAKVGEFPRARPRFQVNARLWPERRDTGRAMSQESVEVVRAAYVALDTRGLDAFAEYWAEDIEWQTIRDRWRGREAGRAYLQELVDLFEGFRTEPLELLDAGGQRVVVYLRYGGRSKHSGIPVPPEYFAIVIEVRDGKIAHALEYGTRRDALEAVGLSE